MFIPVKQRTNKNNIGSQKIIKSSPQLESFVPVNQRITVSLSPDLKGLIKSDTKEVISRDKMTPEIKSIYTNLLKQTQEAQQKAVSGIDTSIGGAIKSVATGVYEGVKGLASAAKEYIAPSDPAMRQAYKEQAQLKNVIPSYGTALKEYGIGTGKFIASEFVNAAGFIDSLVTKKEDKEMVKAMYNQAKVKLAPTPNQIPAFIAGNISEVVITNNLAKTALLSIPSLAKFATTYPKIFDMVSMGAIGTGYGQVKLPFDTEFKKRLIQAPVDFVSWAAFSAMGGIPKTKPLYYVPGYFSIGYFSSLMEGKTQNEAVSAGLGSMALGTVFKLTDVPQKARDILKEQSDAVLKKYGIKNEIDFKKAQIKWHPDKLGGDEAVFKAISSAWAIKTLNPEQLDDSLMKEFGDLFKSIVKQPATPGLLNAPAIIPTTPAIPKTSFIPVAQRATTIAPAAQTSAISPVSGVSSNILQPLAQEARKYKSAEGVIGTADNFITNKSVLKNLPNANKVKVVIVDVGSPEYNSALFSPKGKVKSFPLEYGEQKGGRSALIPETTISTYDSAILINKNWITAIEKQGKNVNAELEKAITHEAVHNERYLKGKPMGEIAEISAVKAEKAIPKEFQPLVERAKNSKSFDDFISKFKEEAGNFCIDL